MVEALDNLRSTLSSTAEQAWSDQEGARQALEGTLDDHSDEIEDCITERANPQNCLEELFEDEGLASDLEGDWDGGDFADVITSLRDIQQNWSQEARDAVAEIASDNNLSQLHRWCMTGRIEDVSDEIDVGDFGDELNAEFGFSSPSTGQQCLQSVALIQDLRTDLEEAWETAAGA